MLESLHAILTLLVNTLGSATGTALFLISTASTYDSIYKTLGIYQEVPIAIVGESLSDLTESLYTIRMSTENEPVLLSYKDPIIREEVENSSGDVALLLYTAKTPCNRNLDSIIERLQIHEFPSQAVNTFLMIGFEEAIPCRFYGQFVALTLKNVQDFSLLQKSFQDLHMILEDIATDNENEVLELLQNSAKSIKSNRLPALPDWMYITASLISRLYEEESNKTSFYDELISGLEAVYENSKILQSSNYISDFFIQKFQELVASNQLSSKPSHQCTNFNFDDKELSVFFEDKEYVYLPEPVFKKICMPLMESMNTNTIANALSFDNILCLEGNGEKKPKFTSKMPMVYVNGAQIRKRAYRLKRSYYDTTESDQILSKPWVGPEPKVLEYIKYCNTPVPIKRSIVIPKKRSTLQDVKGEKNEK